MNVQERPDYKIVLDLISAGAKVLDLGCGEGDLLDLLHTKKNIDGRGIELSSEGVSSSISKGLSVIQGNLEENIRHYPDQSFDFSILSQTLQELHNPEHVLDEMLRISKHSIISFYNLAHYRYRLKILFQGQFPKSEELPYNWMTTNVTFLSIKDFRAYCHDHGVHIDAAVYLANDKPAKLWPNLRSNLCVFQISRKPSPNEITE